MELEKKNETRRCQQCTRELPISRFNQTKSRSTGAHKSSTGYSKTCKDCTSMNTYAYSLMNKETLTQSEQYKLKKFKHAYEVLYRCGAVLPAIGRRLLGLDNLETVVKKKAKMDAMFDVIDQLEQSLKVDTKTNKISETEEVEKVHSQFYVDLVHSMEKTDLIYACADDAYDALREYTADNLVDYADCNELIEEWFDKEDNA